MAARILLDYNEKGGVGKTTCEGLQSYILAHEGYKILDIDLDPQHNLTDMIAATYRDGKHFHPARELGKALENDDLGGSICNAGKNIDIAPASLSLAKFQEWDNDNLSRKYRYLIVKQTLKPFLNSYDFIFLDVPPTFNPFSFNAIFACTDLTLIVQTQQSSYTSACDTVSVLDDLVSNYGLKVNFTGVILYLMINARVDNDIKNKTGKTFKGFVFHNYIKYQERVKGFSDYGITNNDMWDKRSLRMYKALTNETLRRIGVNK